MCSVFACDKALGVPIQFSETIDDMSVLAYPEIPSRPVLGFWD